MVVPQLLMFVLGVNAILAISLAICKAGASLKKIPLYQIDAESTVGGEAFSRIAPTIPTIVDVVTSTHLFDVLTDSTGGRLSFSVCEKYLAGLERVSCALNYRQQMKKMVIRKGHLLGRN
ncbi:uncharacterized protein LOC131236357 [Magnolia sinica]|uniref:uncharacterized protein LOC131236357 n=1 Tax=Magnolia sinica TaxID=86752 RepID=UPI00265A3EF4|nr:uncharacterized protein LOC131236357 [Magnolia sinica]